MGLQLLLDENLSDAGDEADLELTNPFANGLHPGASNAFVEIEHQQVVAHLLRAEETNF